MKNKITLILFTLVLAACGGDDKSVEDLVSRGNLEAIKSKRNELKEQQRELNTSMKLLDSVIATLDTDKQVPLVSTFPVEEQNFQHYLELQGDVKTRQNVLLYAEMSGTLERVYVKEGDKVNAGQILARIDDGGMGSQLEQLKTQAALAKTTYERQARLWEQNIGSEIQYLQAKTNYEASQNAVKQAESQLGKSTIRAPFSGIVDDVMQDQGSTVNPASGAAVFRLVNLSDMYVTVDVPENYIESVKPGKEVKIYFPVLGDSITTKVRQTGNFINPTNRAFSAEIPVPNTQGVIKPNLTARVQINDYTSENALLIPPSVISENAEGEQYVYVVVNVREGNIGEAEKRVVQTGKIQGNQVEILQGLQPGDHVILEGARRIREGQEIEIDEKEDKA